MNTTEQNLEALKDIRSMMERSSRFISLSGWSGVSAGLCALIGAWLAYGKINQYNIEKSTATDQMQGRYIFKDGLSVLEADLIRLAIGVFVIACISAFLFTYIKSRKTGTTIWGNSAQRLLWNTLLPMVAGGLVIIRLMETGSYLLVAPVCLIFYGLGLINGSKYTLGEIRYLGYLEMLLGFIGLWVPGYGLTLWATGFGLLHIIYGITMWWKYDKREEY